MNYPSTGILAPSLVLGSNFLLVPSDLLRWEQYQSPPIQPNRELYKIFPFLGTIPLAHLSMIRLTSTISGAIGERSMILEPS